MQILFLLCNMVVVSSMMQYTIHYSFVVHTSTFVVQNWTPPVHFFSVQTWTPPVHFFTSDLDSSSTLFQYRPGLTQYTFFQYRPGLLQYTLSVQTWTPPVHFFSTDLGSSSTQVYLQYRFASPSTQKTLFQFCTQTQASNTIFLQVQFAGGTICLGLQSLN